MAEIVEQIEFVGEFQLSQNDKESNETLINSIIAQKWPVYLRLILGVELGNEFIADFDGGEGPTEPRFEAIFEAFQFDDNRGIRESPGMVDIMKSFMYYEIIKNSGEYHSTDGVMRTEGENSIPSGIRTKLSVIYNEAIQWAVNVQWFVDVHNPDEFDYDDYNGQILNPIGLF